MILAVMIVLTLGAVAQVWYVGRLFRRSLSLPLLSFLIYLILWNVLGLFEFEFFYFIRFLPPGGQLGLLVFMGLNTVVLEAGLAYFFIDFLRRWAGQKFPPLLRAGIVAPFVVIFAFHAVETTTWLRTDPSRETFQISAPWAGNLMMLLLFLALAAAWIDAGRSAAPEICRQRRLFTVATAGGLALFGASIWGLFSGGRDWFSQLSLSAFLALIANTPGIFILRGAARSYLFSTDPSRSPDRWARLANRYVLSPREVEIAALVLSGKSNLEIAAQAFISPETVKKHISNIYKKTGVKNRLGLMNLIQRLG